jgi:hypothetical protein
MFNETENLVKCKSSEPCSTVTSITKPLTEEIPVTPDIIPAGPVFVKLPVVLAEANVTIPVEATIKLDHVAV